MMSFLRILTEILDNTHVHFFTRSSFEKMAAASGWAVIGEKAKEIRVGETEIQNTYKQVPREVYKELLHRPHGNVYQYMFTLVPSERISFWGYSSNSKFG